MGQACSTLDTRVSPSGDTSQQPAQACSEMRAALTSRSWASAPAEAGEEGAGRAWGQPAWSDAETGLPMLEVTVLHWHCGVRPFGSVGQSPAPSGSCLARRPLLRRPWQGPHPGNATSCLSPSSVTNPPRTTAPSWM